MTIPATVKAPVERLVFFSDAAVAIALTLLILPLMDGVGEAARAGLSTADYLADNLNSLGAFALSFLLIARFWRAHHQLFAAVEEEPPGLFWVNMAWLFSVVFLPVATATTGALPTDAAQLCLYQGTMIVISALMAVMTILLRRHPETCAEGAGISIERVHSTLVFTALLVVSLALALVVPHLGYWSLLVLLAARPVHWVVDRVRASTA
ncbi:MAG: TMEM175 family protein [Propionibacteriales bacterium]|nr:TMEM175 family protein [Propionibacteriales bacterium]